MPRRRGKIREALAIPLVAGSICSATPPSSPADSLRWISAGDVALALFAYVTTPVWIGLALASVSSPGFVLERTPQGWHSGYSFGTGIGWSGDSALWTFSRLRLQAEYEHIRTGAATLTALLDWNALPVLLPKASAWAGASVQASDGVGHPHSPTCTGSSGCATPWGCPTWASSRNTRSACGYGSCRHARGCPAASNWGLPTRQHSCGSPLLAPAYAEVEEARLQHAPDHRGIEVGAAGSGKDGGRLERVGEVLHARVELQCTEAP
jgi:hypothetical protein